MDLQELENEFLDIPDAFSLDRFGIEMAELYETELRKKEIEKDV